MPTMLLQVSFNLWCKVISKDEVCHSNTISWCSFDFCNTSFSVSTNSKPATYHLHFAKV